MDRALEICPKAQRKQQGQQEPVTVMLRIYINLFQLFGYTDTLLRKSLQRSVGEG